MSGAICAFSSSVTWAIGITYYSRLARTNSPFAVNFTRAAVAAACFGALALISGEDFASIRFFNAGWFLVAITCGYGIGDALFLLSTRTLGVPAASAISSSFPLFSALAGWIFLGQSLSAGNLVGLFLVVGGTILVILSGYRFRLQRETDGSARGILDRYWVGVALAIGTSLLWALNAFGTSRGGMGLPIPVANTLRMSIAVVLCAVYGRILGRSKRLAVPWGEFKGLAWVFVLEGFGGSFFFLYGLTHASLAVASALSSLAPVIAVPIAVISRAERFSAAKTVGIVMVVAGAWLLVRPAS